VSDFLCWFLYGHRVLTPGKFVGNVRGGYVERQTCRCGRRGRRVLVPQ
jgi:hypothetical protein